MKRNLIMVLLVLCLVTAHAADSGFAGRPIEDNVVMPTGYTLNKGEFTLGLGSIGYGLGDRFTLGSNLLLFLFQDFNFNAKYSLIKNENSALALGLSLHRFDMEVLDSDLAFTSISPFVSYSARIGNKSLLHIGGQYSYYSGDVDVEEAKASINSKGTSFSVGLEQDIGTKTKFLAETGYDLTFKGFRAGGAFLFGWKTFRLKLGLNYYAPEGSDGYYMPLIGLWWRFGG